MAKAAVVPKQARVSGDTIKVRATQLCYYDEARRRAGDVFTLRPRAGMFTEAQLGSDGEPKTDPKTGFRVTREVKKVLSAEAQFNPRCMERVAASTPEKTTGNNEALQKLHDEELAARLGGAPPAPPDPTGDANPLGLEGSV